MGNRLIFGDRAKYAALEGGFGGSILELISAIVIVLAIIHWIRFFKKNYCDCKEKRYQDSENSQKSNCDACCGACTKYCTSLESLHNILGMMFSNITQIVATGNDKPSLIISDREIQRPITCTGCFTYAYYTYMLLVSLMWFIAIAIDFSVYRKTTTCNDINIKVKSFRCFEVGKKFQIVNCESPGVDEKNVICYLYSPSIAGLGVAFSIAKLISVVADIAYNMIFKITNKSLALGISVRILCIILAVLALIAYLAVTGTKAIDEEYFTLGLVPMRIAQLLLLCLTIGGILVFPPWCQHSTDKYRKKVLLCGIWRC